MQCYGCSCSYHEEGNYFRLRSNVGRSMLLSDKIDIPDSFTEMGIPADSNGERQKS